jgi:hypothetical protein
MAFTRARKKILLVSDHESVAKIIEHLSARDLEITRCMLPVPGDALPQFQAQDFDLLILALSSFANEPIVALARTSMADLIGKIPILVISGKPFQSDSASRISHLDLLFSVDELNIRVREILQTGSGHPDDGRVSQTDE